MHLALAVAAAAAVFSVAYSADAAQGASEMRFACAKKGSGQLRYAARAGDCRRSSERLIRLRADSMVACAHRGGYVYRAANRAACRRKQHRPSLALKLPGNGRESFCAHKKNGRLRSTSHVPYARPRPPRVAVTACKANERRVFVKRGNQRPRAVDDRATVGEDRGASIEVLENDSDRDGGRLTVAAVDAAGARGTVAIAEDRRAVTYDPGGRFEALGAGARATDSFTYRATDRRRSDGASVTITVTGANDLPRAGADAGATTEDAATTIAVLANDGDPDQGDALSVTAIDTTGTVGAVALDAGGSLRYDPSGRFDDLRAGGRARTDHFAYTLSDGHGGRTRGSVSVTVSGTNDPPRVTTSDGALAYTEGAAAAVVDGGLTVADVDHDMLDGARIRLSAGFEPGDVLQFADQNGVTGSYDAATGVLALSGWASAQHYETALRSVEYRHTGDHPAPDKTVEFRADDRDGPGTASSREIDVTAVNDAPVVGASGGSAAFTEGGGAVAVDPGLTVDDPDSAQLSGATVAIANGAPAQDSLGFSNQNGIAGAYDAANDVLTLSGTASVADYRTALRSVTYANSSSNPSTATRSVSFRVTDTGALASNVASRDVTVAATDDAPVVTASGGSLAWTEGDPATAVDAGLTVTDPDDTDLESATISIVTGFESGDELQYTNQNGITGSYDAGTGVLTLTGTSSVANYQAALRSVAYRHTGDDPAIAKAVEFKANDGSADSAPAIRGIVVTPVNDAPALATSNASLTYAEDAGAVAIDAGLTVTDLDSTQISGATVTISANFQPPQDDLAFTDQNGITGSYDDATGVLTLSGAASVGSYQAALRSVAYINVSEGPAPPTRTISFQASDAGALSNVATREIAITAANDPPVAANDTGTTDEDSPLNVAAPAVLANDTDVDPGDTTTVVQLNGSGTLTGTSTKGAPVTINANGSYAYDPGSVFQGLSTGDTDSDSFTYTVADGADARSTATVALTITGVSDAPAAVADTYHAIGNTGLFAGTAKPAGEAGKEVTGSVLSNDTDPDTAQGDLAVEPVTNVPTTLGGTITIEADGNFTYHPDDGDTAATDTFTYRRLRRLALQRRHRRQQHRHAQPADRGPGLARAQQRSGRRRRHLRRPLRHARRSGDRFLDRRHRLRARRRQHRDRPRHGVCHGVQ